MTTEWSKEQIEEMFGDDVIEQLAFLSGCIKHSYCDPKNPDLDGYIVSHEKLTKFAELIVRECVGVVKGGSFLHDQAPAAIFAKECSAAINRHFGVEE